VGVGGGAAGRGRRGGGISGAAASLGFSRVEDAAGREGQENEGFSKFLGASRGNKSPIRETDRASRSLW
jgi:hypothetical protein